MLFASAISESSEGACLSKGLRTRLGAEDDARGEPPLCVHVLPLDPIL